MKMNNISIKQIGLYNTIKRLIIKFFLFCFVFKLFVNRNVFILCIYLQYMLIGIISTSLVSSYVITLKRLLRNVSTCPNVTFFLAAVLGIEWSRRIACALLWLPSSGAADRLRV